LKGEVIVPEGQQIADWGSPVAEYLLSSDLCHQWKSVAKNPPAIAGGTDKNGDRVPFLTAVSPT